MQSFRCNFSKTQAQIIHPFIHLKAGEMLYENFNFESCGDMCSNFKLIFDCGCDVQMLNDV